MPLDLIWAVKLKKKKKLNITAAAAKSLQSCPALCDPPTGSAVPGILQARTLEWVAISFSSAWKWKVKVKSLSCVRLLATTWTAAHQTPPSASAQVFRSTGNPSSTIVNSATQRPIFCHLKQWTKALYIQKTHWLKYHLWEVCSKDTNWYCVRKCKYLSWKPF